MSEELANDDRAQKRYSKRNVIFYTGGMVLSVFAGTIALSGTAVNRKDEEDWGPFRRILDGQEKLIETEDGHDEYIFDLEITEDGVHNVGLEFEGEDKIWTVEEGWTYAIPTSGPDESGYRRMHVSGTYANQIEYRLEQFNQDNL